MIRMLRTSGLSTSLARLALHAASLLTICAGLTASPICDVIGRPLFAQEEKDDEKGAEAPKRLIEREPFDRIKLDAANRGVSIDVFPLNFPNGRIPANKETPIQLRLIKYPFRIYELNWRAVDSI